MEQPNKSIISIGELIYSMLTSNAEIMATANKIFPVIAEDAANLPYICYKRTALSQDTTKTKPGAYSASVQFWCYAEDYHQSIVMAEALRKALDGQRYTYVDGDGNALHARSIVLSDTEESWADGAYSQVLVFQFKV